VLLGGVECAGVVKADAYGLCAAEVGPALAKEGCRTFFVAHVGEGVALRMVLGPKPAIYVLNGAPPGAEAECVAHGLAPVINSLEQLAAWREAASGRQGAADSAASRQRHGAWDGPRRRRPAAADLGSPAA
jgi:alanine racemase